MTVSYGRRLLVSVLVKEATHNPNRAFAMIPKSDDDIRDDFEHITFQEVNKATDEVFRLLCEAFPQLERHETITYIGASDLRYNLMFYAALKRRAKVLLPSSQNAAQATAALLQQTASTKLVYSAEAAAVVEDLLAVAPGVSTLQLPSLAQLRSANPPPVPYDLKFDQVRREPMLVLHSSGSTGWPKPITMTHGSFAVMDGDHNAPDIPGRRAISLKEWDSSPGSHVYTPAPPFHASGFFLHVVMPLYSYSLPVFSPSRCPPTPDVMASIFRSTDISLAFLPPHHVVDLYNYPGGPELLGNLRSLTTGGGPLPKELGDKLAKRVRIGQGYGITEVGILRQLEQPEWQYMEFHPTEKLEFEPVGDGTFELIVHADESTEEQCAFNHNFPGVPQFRTKDLFEPHPTKPNLWKFLARRDDIMVLLSGEKFNPLLMESAVESLPGVKGALMTGKGCHQSALIVELQTNHNLGDKPLENLWPTISEVNSKMAKAARITPARVMFTKPSAPFVRAGKGTVVRKLSEALYKEEIYDVVDNHPITVV